MFGVCRDFLELIEGGMGKKEGTPAWDYTYHPKLHKPPNILYSIHRVVAHVGVGGKAVLFELK